MNHDSNDITIDDENMNRSGTVGQSNSIENEQSDLMENTQLR